MAASSIWVRMNDFESEWSSLSQPVWANGWIQDGRIQDGSIIEVDIIKLMIRIEFCLSQVSEWRKSVLIWIWDLSQDNILVTWTSLNQSLDGKWLNPRWQNSRWLPSLKFCQNGLSHEWIKLRSDSEQDCIWVDVHGWIHLNGRVQDGAILDSMDTLLESSDSEWEEEFWAWLNPRWNLSKDVWVRVRVEGECFWSKMAVSESNMADFKMAAIIKESAAIIQDSRIQDGCNHHLSENDEEVFLKWQGVCWQCSEMAAIIKLSQTVLSQIDQSQSLCKWLNPRWQNSSDEMECHHQVSQI